MGYAGEPEEAIRLLQEGLGLLEEEREPGLELAAVHNQLMFLVDCGRFQEARKLLAPNRRRLREAGAKGAGGRLNGFKVAWIEGRIAAGLQELPRAVATLRRVRRGLAEADLSYQAAVASLDLAVVLLRQGQAGEAELLVEEAAGTFLALRIEREALGAILMLRQAFAVRMATTALLEDVTSFFRRAEHDPSARFQPTPAGAA
jgi:hypothetical protein